MPHCRRTLCLTLLVSLIANSARSEQPSTAQPVAGDNAKAAEFFERRVRPLLAKHCYECHSAESEELAGGLALDSAAGWRAGGDSGPAIVPGDISSSLLIQAVRYEQLEMPPQGRLPDAEVAILEKWIASGAYDPRETAAPAATPADEIDLEAGRRFWAFQPPRRHEPPAVTDTSWPLTDIDRFVLARLEQARLEPAPDADRRSWIRRVTYDLTGLPPSETEVQSFINDDSPQAYARVVDRLLASPQFGEHWGRHWMDVARYADSNGSDFNATFYHAWRYRNYVIAAFNNDKPYDQFIREQLAGDLLPYDDDQQRAEQLVATGMLMIGTKMLSERDKTKLYLDVADEQIDAVGRAFLGMTLACARCHDHKFDPIPTEDYYALAGIFVSTESLRGESQQYVSTWKDEPLPIEANHAAALARYEKAKSALNKQLEEAQKALKTMRDNGALAQLLAEGILVDDLQAEVIGSWKKSQYSPQYVGEGYLHDEQQGKGQKRVIFPVQVPESGEYEVRLAYASSSNRASSVPVTVEHAEGTSVIQVDQTQKPKLAELFEPIGKFHFVAGQPNRITISNDGTEAYVMADAVQLVAIADPALAAAGTDSPHGESASSADTAAAENQAARIQQLEAEIQSCKQQLQELEADAPPPAPMAMAVREAEKIEDTRLRVRGETYQLGAVVPRGFPQVLSGERHRLEHPQQSGRLELADWIARQENPLTARVMVNRIWHHLLGQGLVSTVDNFGQLGDRPSHPELLDTLAVQFMDEGWSVKRMIRQISLSRVYRMSSRYDTAAAELDPDNRLLWRTNRRRLPAEAIRDTLLKISGQLDMSQGESPVSGLGRIAITNNADSTRDGEVNSTSQRSVYLPIVRNDLPVMLTVFDFADPDLVTGRRPVTNVPAQALWLLNSPFVRRAAELTADQLVEQHPDDAERRLDEAYRRILGRPPSDTDRRRALDYLQQLSSDAGDVTSEQESWVRLVQVLFASTEFRWLN